MYMTVNSSSIFNSQNLKITQMFTNRQINTLWCIHLMVYHSAIKSNKLLIRVTWVNLKIIWLKDTRPKEYVTMILFISNSEKCKLVHSDSRLAVGWGWGWGWREWAAEL